MAKVRGFGWVSFLGGVDERGDGSAVGGRLSGDGMIVLGSTSEGEHLCLVKDAIVRSIRKLKSATLTISEHSLLA